jgi:sporulation-control protein spo0M
MRLPPNGRQLVDLRRAGRVPLRQGFGQIAILPDWGFEVSGAFVTVPPEFNLADLDFCFVAGLEVVLFTRTGRPVADLLDLVLMLMDADAAAIIVIDIDRAARGLDHGILAVYGRRQNVQ